MKKFNKIASKYANFLRFFIMIALGILGALLIVLMFGQLLAIGQRMLEIASFTYQSKFWMRLLLSSSFLSFQQ